MNNPSEENARSTSESTTEKAPESGAGHKEPFNQQFPAKEIPAKVSVNTPPVAAKGDDEVMSQQQKKPS